MKIYLAHGLTQAPEAYKQRMLDFRQKLKEKFEVLEYFGLGEGSPEQVFEHDFGCVKNCDLLLAEVSWPGLGLGFEIATALFLGKQVLACATSDAKLSRMVLGINLPNYKLIKYSDEREILDYLTVNYSK
jgi:hypothetical protein